MMDQRLKLWIEEIRRFNPRLHLVGAATLDAFSRMVAETLELLMQVTEPVLADLGSGSGLPGIPYAVTHADARVHLIERSRKKAVFLQHVIDHLGLDNAQVHALDPLMQPAGPFPAVISRAFSPRGELPKVLGRVLACGGSYYELGTLAEQMPQESGFELRQVYTGSSALLLRVYGFN